LNVGGEDEMRATENNANLRTLERSCHSSDEERIGVIVIVLLYLQNVDKIILLSSIGLGDIRRGEANCLSSRHPHPV
jgi:hypothetical protein